MIREIFLPEKIGSYYVFSERIAACEVTRSHIRITVVKTQAKNHTIEKIVEKQIVGDLSLPYNERAGSTLNEALSSIGSYDKFYVITPANLVITKELTVPFVNPEKIKLILPFEIEPLLPFPLSDATIDCIVTNTQEGASTVLACAIKNDILAEQLALFDKAGVKPTRVTVDLIELYALYKSIYPDSKQNVVLLYMGLHTIRMGIVVGGQLKSLRLLPQGILKFAKLLNQDNEHLIRSGLEGNTPDLITQCAPFFSDVLFTIQSSASKLSDDQKFNKIMLMGSGSDIRGLPKIIEGITHIPCEILSAHAILQNSLAIMGENHGIPNSSLISTATALSLPISEDFSLYKVTAEAAEEKIFTGRLIALASLVLIIIGSIFVSGYLNSRRFKKEIEASEKEAVALLKKAFPSMSSRYGTTGLDAIKNAARAEVAREKNIWFALSTQNRASYLHYLQELFTRLDAVGLGLNLTRLTLDEETLTLEGSVKDFEALKQLEEDLRQSKLFTTVPRLQELKFSAKITLDKSYGEG